MRISPHFCGNTAALSVSVISNGDKQMQALKVLLYPYHDVINYTNNLITFLDILRSISGSG